MRLYVAVTASLALTLAACGEAEDQPAAQSAETSAAEQSDDKSEQTTGADDGKDKSSEAEADSDAESDAANETASITAAESNPSTITLTVDGLVIGGSNETTLKFGSKKDAIVTAVKALLGSAEMGTNEECGVGPLQFATFDDLQLTFQNGQFSGWGADGAGDNVKISGENGLKIGALKSKVSELPGYEPYLESTLGDEFHIARGEDKVILGIYGDNGRVTDLWTGAACTFR